MQNYTWKIIFPFVLWSKEIPPKGQDSASLVQYHKHWPLGGISLDTTRNNESTTLNRVCYLKHRYGLALLKDQSSVVNFLFRSKSNSCIYIYKESITLHLTVNVWTSFERDHRIFVLRITLCLAEVSSYLTS